MTDSVEDEGAIQRFMSKLLDKLPGLSTQDMGGPEIEERHRVAAAWWSQFIAAEEVSHKTQEPRDLFGEAFASWAREKMHGDGYDEEVVEDFVAALEKELAEGEAEKDWGTFYVATDYHPGPILKEACAAVDIKPGMTLFPKKTGMWFEEDGIYVKVGHGADREKIWPSGDDAG